MTATTRSPPLASRFLFLFLVLVSLAWNIQVAMASGTDYCMVEASPSLPTDDTTTSSTTDMNNPYAGEATTSPVVIAQKCVSLKLADQVEGEDAFTNVGQVCVSLDAAVTSSLSPEQAAANAANPFYTPLMHVILDTTQSEDYILGGTAHVFLGVEEADIPTITASTTTGNQVTIYDTTQFPYQATTPGTSGQETLHVQVPTPNMECITDLDAWMRTMVISATVRKRTPTTEDDKESRYQIVAYESVPLLDNGDSTSHAEDKYSITVSLDIPDELTTQAPMMATQDQTNWVALDFACDCRNYNPELSRLDEGLFGSESSSGAMSGGTMTSTPPKFILEATNAPANNDDDSSRGTTLDISEWVAGTAAVDANRASSLDTSTSSTNTTTTTNTTQGVPPKDPNTAGTTTTTTTTEDTNDHTQRGTILNTNTIVDQQEDPVTVAPTTAQGEGSTLEDNSHAPTTASPTSTKMTTAPPKEDGSDHSNAMAEVVRGQAVTLGTSFLVVHPASALGETAADGEASVEAVTRDLLQQTIESFVQETMTTMAVPAISTTSDEGGSGRKLWVTYDPTTITVYDFLVSGDCSKESAAVASPTNLRGSTTTTTKQATTATTNNNNPDETTTSSTCYRAYAKVGIRMVDEDLDLVCQLVEQEMAHAFEHDKLQHALLRTTSATNAPNLQLTGGTFEYCIPTHAFAETEQELLLEDGSHWTEGQQERHDDRAQQQAQEAKDKATKDDDMMYDDKGPLAPWMVAAIASAVIVTLVVCVACLERALYKRHLRREKLEEKARRAQEREVERKKAEKERRKSMMKNGSTRSHNKSTRAGGSSHHSKTMRGSSHHSKTMRGSSHHSKSMRGSSHHSQTSEGSGVIS